MKLFAILAALLVPSVALAAGELDGSGRYFAIVEAPAVTGARHPLPAFRENFQNKTACEAYARGKQKAVNGKGKTVPAVILCHPGYAPDR